MSQELYSLDIVSQHPDFKGKKLKQYKVDDENYVGAWQNEPFEIVFKNNTHEKVQVKISIDGTDILTGQLADTVINKDMWIVNAYGTLKLQAWPETTEAGAQFVFTSQEKSVAMHTHGNMSSQGIIAAAVFTEGYQSAFLNPQTRRDYYLGSSGGGFYKSGAGILRGLGNTAGDYYKGCTTITTGTTTLTGSDLVFGNEFLCSDQVTLCDAAAANVADEVSVSFNSDSKGLESFASVGAGQQVSQMITTAAGLYQPKFNSIVKVKYAWWSDLVPKLEAGMVKVAQGNGFPGDKKNLMSLGTTPRVGEAPVSSPQPALTRF